MSANCVSYVKNRRKSVLGFFEVSLFESDTVCGEPRTQVVSGHIFQTTSVSDQGSVRLHISCVCIYSKTGWSGNVSFHV